MEAAKETVNNLISAASNMVYGDTTQSDTTTTGNKDSLLGDETKTSTSNTTGGIEPVSGQSGPGTANKPYDTGNTTGEPTNTTSSTSGSSDPTDTSTSKSSATATTAHDVGSAPPESGAAPTTKQQGADKPNDAPDSSETAAISNKKEAAEDAMDDGPSSGSSDPTNTTGTTTTGSSGPGAGSDDAGPKPLSETSGKPSSSSKDDDALGSKSEEKGTGEKYIKSSGVKADGGDFDAANAGAGKEADRLLEEKGIHREAGNTGPPQEIPGETAGGSEDKVSFGQKLKDKLHIKNKDKP